MSSTGPDVGQFHVLCVCTGNVYRSRIAEHELRRLMVGRFGHEAGRFVITSAGTRATTGQPLRSSELRDLHRLGVDHGSQVTRHLEAADVHTADLVLGADRTHRTVVLELAPAALRRTFMLGELSRIGTAAAKRANTGLPFERLDPVQRASLVVAAASKHRGTVPVEGSDDIADPWNQPAAALDLVARQVRDAVARIVNALVGPRVDVGAPH